MSQFVSLMRDFSFDGMKFQERGNVQRRLTKLQNGGKFGAV